jgi:hypothetical protein
MKNLRRQLTCASDNQMKWPLSNVYSERKLIARSLISLQINSIFNLIDLFWPPFFEGWLGLVKLKTSNEFGMCLHNEHNDNRYQTAERISEIIELNAFIILLCTTSCYFSLSVLAARQEVAINLISILCSQIVESQRERGKYKQELVAVAN